MSYRIILGGNSPYSYSIFKVQKRIIRIIMNAGYMPTESYCTLFEKSNVLPLYSQYIFSLSTFVVKNTDILKSIPAIHSINTRQGSDLHPLITNLTKAHKSSILLQN
jgi:hypothetical protein